MANGSCRTWVSALSAMMLLSVLTLLSTPVSAQADNTWIATTTQNASNAAYWENGTLAAGQNIWFIDAYDGSCSWDVANTFGDFKIRTGYAGTITQGAAFTITSYNQVAGIFTASTSYWLTCTGNFIQLGGTITYDKLKLTMSGITKSLTFTQAGPAQNLDSVIFAGSTTVTQNTINNPFGYEVSIATAMTVNAGVIVTIASGSTIRYGTGATGANFVNNGQIDGPGLLRFMTYNLDKTILFGTVNAPVQLYAHSASTQNSVITLAGNTVLGGALSAVSAHATRTITLDLSASNYALSAIDITIGTRGIINARASTIPCLGNWDSSAGTFTKATSTVKFTGSSKTLKTAGTGFYNLIIEAGASYTLQSNVKTENYWKNGTLILNGNTLTVNNDQAPVFTTTPSVFNVSYLMAYSYDADTYDREGTIITYGLETFMPELTINSATGFVNSTAPLTIGTYLVGISASDGNHTVWQSFILEVMPLEEPPPETPSISFALVIIPAMIGVVLLIAWKRW